MRVLQHQQDRIALAQTDDLVDKQRDGRRLALRRSERQLRQRGPRRNRQELSQQWDRGFVRRGPPGEHDPELVDAGICRVRWRKSGSAREMLDDRIERAVAVIRRALQVNPGVSMGDIFLQRLDRARFADTSLADHGDDLTLARAGETPALEHQPHFVRPADERQRTGADRGEAALDRRFAEHAPSGHGVRKSFEFVRAGGFKVEQSAEQTLRRLADENRVGLGERLKPRGEIRRVADDGTLLRGAEADDLADHDQTGRDPDPGPSP